MSNLNIHIDVDFDGLDEIIKVADKIANQEIDRTLDYFGNVLVIEGRDRPQVESWFDRTGNLRSSIGYKRTGTEPETDGGFMQMLRTATEGAMKGKEYADDCLTDMNQPHKLVVVAGMEYASEVEAMKNKVVLASAETLAEEMAPRLEEKTADRIAKLVQDYIDTLDNED